MSGEQGTGSNEGGNSNTTGGNTPPAGDQFQAITSQADLDKVIGERLARERAKFADYADAKAKAARLDEIEAANATELEKATKRAADAEAKAAAAEATALRARIQATHGITDEDAALFLTGTDEETLTRQAKALAERGAPKRRGPHVPKEGPTAGGTAPQDTDERGFVRNLFGGN